MDLTIMEVDPMVVTVDLTVVMVDLTIMEVDLAVVTVDQVVVMVDLMVVMMDQTIMEVDQAVVTVDQPVVMMDLTITEVDPAVVMDQAVIDHKSIRDLHEESYDCLRNKLYSLIHGKMIDMQLSKDLLSPTDQIMYNDPWPKYISFNACHNKLSIFCIKLPDLSKLYCS